MISPSYVDGLDLRIKELTQSNKALTTALEKVSDYNSRLERQLSDERMKNLRLETDRDAWVATIGQMIYLIERVYDSYKNNTGYEPSLSVFHRDLDEAYRFLDKTPKQCLVEIKAVSGRAGYVEGYLDGYNDNALDEFNQDSYADLYAAKVRQGGE